MTDTRRTTMTYLAALPLILLRGGPLEAQTRPLAPTPACGKPSTPSQTEGPFFKPNSPMRANIAAGLPGMRFTVSGRVLDRSCRPIPGAQIELWQADAAGNYDERGDRLRGHIFSDEAGAFRFETIRPGRYPGRTPHLHIKVQRPRGRVLTTQLYFPDEPGNRRDGIYDRRLVMTLAGAEAGRFDFVV
jgi:protocatechuate 3,4-dioxygenase beta subunit